MVWRNKKKAELELEDEEMMATIMNVTIELIFSKTFNTSRLIGYSINSFTSFKFHHSLPFHLFI